MPSFSTTGQVFGGFSVDRATFRTLFPDARWLIYAAGQINLNDASDGTAELLYYKNDGTTVSLGTLALTGGAGLQKVRMGPYDLFATVGVPKTENVVTVRLKLTKTAGVDGTAQAWTVWRRLLAPKQ